MNNRSVLIKRIQQIELQIKKLQYHQTVSDVCCQLYNSLILEKAILKQQLKDMKKNPLIEAVKKVIPKKEKLISDYFKAL